MTDWVQRTNPIRIGDGVALSKPWLQNTGQFESESRAARGVVTGIETTDEKRLVTVQWDTPDLPDQVDLRNLSRLIEKVEAERK